MCSHGPAVCGPDGEEHSMRSLAACVVAILMSTALFAEDPQLRAAAFVLVEHSLQASTPRNSAPIPNETVVTFQARGVDGVMRPGSYSRLYAKPGHVRLEFTFGDYHMVEIDLPDRAAFIGGPRMLPPEEREMMRLVPMQLWHLDHEDIVKSIVQSSKAGVPVTCIEFDTIRGAEKNANEMCFDATTGAQVYDRTGDTELYNTEFFDFADAKLPGDVQQYRNGTLMFDVHVTRRVITDPVSDDIFTPPAGADIGMRCKTFTRAFAQSTPEPPGNGGATTSVILHGVIGIDGRVHNAVVESSDRPDLNEEATKIVQQWTFTPSMCNGQPNPQEANLVVKFTGR